ncbi:hypothetical protein PROFUN_15916 [Planoprotostelium fungivorum]|uniref:Uncharacterized protein n=1 Tax=Planoprotostelium fungivorum TaxID=1890364 RepID=A0A2P6MU47_9EUKA|nr:hypothetical protein PROFUN_15916 [Planoprotostelium fungivorum]
MDTPVRVIKKRRSITGVPPSSSAVPVCSSDTPTIIKELSDAHINTVKSLGHCEMEVKDASRYINIPVPQGKNPIHPDNDTIVDDRIGPHSFWTSRILAEAKACDEVHKVLLMYVDTVWCRTSRVTLNERLQVGETKNGRCIPLGSCALGPFRFVMTRDFVTSKVAMVRKRTRIDTKMKTVEMFSYQFNWKSDHWNRGFPRLFTDECWYNRDVQLEMTVYSTNTWERWNCPPWVTNTILLHDAEVHHLLQNKSSMVRFRTGVTETGNNWRGERVASCDLISKSRNSAFACGLNIFKMERESISQSPGYSLILYSLKPLPHHTLFRHP